jgi:lipoprotein-anchoring transpeptidase ErfK/SrfK
MKRLALLALVLLAAGCGGHARETAPPAPKPHPKARAKPHPKPHPPTTVATVRPAAAPAPARARRCAAATKKIGSERVAYAGYAPDGAVAYTAPGRGVAARFGSENANGYPTFLGVVAERTGCGAHWYRVQLPIRPNGATGWVRASDLRLTPVRTRIEVDVSRRRLTLFERGRRVLTATVAVGSAATPTPIGRFYVNQRLVPDDPRGPYGPGAIGISAFSPVLTGWAQGGPVAIHGTNEPWSIGHAVSNGCIRLPNATLTRLFRVAVAGTPVVIHP